MRSSITRAALAAFGLASVLGAVVLAGPSVASAQEAVVGNLRLAADESGTPLEAEPAGPGEKVYRVDTGTETMLVAFDYTGSGTTPVQIRVMAPQGVVVFQDDSEYDAPGTYVIEVDNGGLPFGEQEYVINTYVEEARYLADSMQILVGDEAQLIPADNEQVAEPGATTIVVDGPDDVAGAMATMQAGGTVTSAEVPDTNAGPSTMLLVLAILGVVGLLGVVAWAGVSAMRQS